MMGRGSEYLAGNCRELGGMRVKELAEFSSKAGG